MDKYRKFLIFPLLLVSAFLISACTGEEDTTEDQDQSPTRVRVINEDEEAEDPTDETDTVEEEEDSASDEVEDEATEEEDESDDEVEDTESVVNQEGLQELDGADASDGVQLNGYSYGIAGGKLEFGWHVGGSSGLPYAMANAGFDEDGNLVVTFPSLAADYLREDLGDMLELGGSLPDVEIKSISGGSQYIFLFGSERDFTLIGDADEGQTVLSVDL